MVLHKQTDGQNLRLHSMQRGKNPLTDWQKL